MDEVIYSFSVSPLLSAFKTLIPFLFRDTDQQTNHSSEDIFPETQNLS